MIWCAWSFHPYGSTTARALHERLHRLRYLLSRKALLITHLRYGTQELSNEGKLFATNKDLEGLTIPRVDFVEAKSEILAYIAWNVVG
ncbi:hypothetical protein OK016_22085 [Vibrio chagasii]|nr:hypothetical protein [Vibrio chagasii]